MSNLEYEYDPYFINEVIDYGHLIGAESVMMMNGDIYLYYRKGDKNSKYYPWMFDPHNQRKLEWAIGNSASVDSVVKFYKNLGWKTEMIDFKTFQKFDLTGRPKKDD